jgi:hypothetical protein
MADRPVTAAAPAARNSNPGTRNNPAGDNSRAAVHNRAARELPAPARLRSRRRRRRLRRQQRTARRASPGRSAIPIHCANTAPKPRTAAELSRSPLTGRPPQPVQYARFELPYCRLCNAERCTSLHIRSEPEKHARFGALPPGFGLGASRRLRASISTTTASEAALFCPGKIRMRLRLI